MESKGDINNKAIKNLRKSQTINSSVLKLLNPDIYIISCFNNFIWDKELFTLKSTNKEVNKIDAIDKKVLIYDKKFYTIIHRINLKERVKSLNLILISPESNKKFNLNQIHLNMEKQIVLFNDIDINQKALNELKKDIKKPEIVRLLSMSEKLKIYYDYFIQTNETELRIIKNNLVTQYLSCCGKDNKILYSDFIKVFCLAFKQKALTYFLDKYINYDIEFDKFENEEFKKILIIYETDKNDFFEKNKKIYKTKNPKEYSVALDNFINLYKLIYRFEESSHLLSKEQLKNVKSILIKLINNKKEIIKRIFFIFFIFEKLFLVFTKDNDIEEEKLYIIIESKDDFLEFDYINFKAVYKELIKEQQKKNKYFLDFSSVFNGLIKIIDKYELLIDIKKLYEKELQIFPNEDFENKISVQIHKKGILKISQGKYDNRFLILFLKNDCKDKYKNYEVLRYFNIELMDDQFFIYFKEAKIYSLYENDFLKYLSQFVKNIKDVKYFSIFFKVLPPKEYSQKTIELLFKWLQDNINTFDIVKCKNFKEEIFIFFNIIANKKVTDIFINLINLVKDNLHDLFNDICISLLNQKKFPLNFAIIEHLITNFLFPDKDINNDKKFEIIKFFLEKVELNEQVLKIFFSKLVNFSLIEEDFYDENSIRFKLLELILNNKNINLTDENIINSDFFQNTVYTCKSLATKIENLNISYKQINTSFKIIGKEYMEERLKCIYKIIQEEENYQVKTKQIFYLICKIIDEWETKMKKIEIMKEYNLFIYDKNEEINIINTQLSEFNKKIFENKLCYLNNEESRKEYSKYINENSFKKVNEILKLRDSNIFIKIFNHLKIKDKGTAPEKSIAEFQKLKNLFSNNEKNILKAIKTNEYFKFLVEIGDKSEALLLQEIDWIINYFDIKYFSHKEFLLEKIRIYIKKKSLIQILSGLLQFLQIYLDIFEHDYQDFINELKKFISRYNSNDIFNIEEFEKIKNYLEDNFKISNYKEEIFNKFFIQKIKRQNI